MWTLMHCILIADWRGTCICLYIPWYAIPTSGSLEVCLIVFRSDWTSWSSKHHFIIFILVFTSDDTERIPEPIVVLSVPPHLSVNAIWIKRKHDAEMPTSARDDGESELNSDWDDEFWKIVWMPNITDINTQFGINKINEKSQNSWPYWEMQFQYKI